MGCYAVNCVTVKSGNMRAEISDLVEEVLGVEMRPVDVAGIQRRRLLVGLSFLVQPVVELQHAVHPTPSVGARVLRHVRRTVRITVHSEKRPAEKRVNETTVNKDDGRPADRRFTTTV